MKNKNPFTEKDGEKIIKVLMEIIEDKFNVDITYRIIEVNETEPPELKKE